MASTKAFTCTLVAFALLALYLGRIRDLSPAAGRRLIDALQKLPDQMREILRDAERHPRRRAQATPRSANAFLHRPRQRLSGGARGRAEAEGDRLRPRRGLPGLGAQARPAGADLPGDADLRRPAARRPATRRSLSSLEEVRARKGPVIAVTHAGDERLPGKVDDTLLVPPTEPELNPILLTVPLQLLAYYAAARARPRHRPAAQPGQERDGGVARPRLRGRSGARERWVAPGPRLRTLSHHFAPRLRGAKSAKGCEVSPGGSGAGPGLLCQQAGEPG